MKLLQNGDGKAIARREKFRSPNSKFTSVDERCDMTSKALPKISLPEYRRSRTTSIYGLDFRRRRFFLKPQLFEFGSGECSHHQANCLRPTLLLPNLADKIIPPEYFDERRAIRVDFLSTRRREGGQRVQSRPLLAQAYHNSRPERPRRVLVYAGTLVRMAGLHSATI